MNDKASKLLILASILIVIFLLQLYDTRDSPYTKSAFFEKTKIQKLIRQPPKANNSTLEVPPLEPEPWEESDTDEPEIPEVIPYEPFEREKRDLTFNQAKDVDRLGASAFLSRDGVVTRKDMRKEFLCKMGMESVCNTREIAEILDLFGVFTPIYAEDQKRQELLYISHANFIGYLDSIGIPSITLEAIYPNQTFLSTRAGNEPRHIQLEINDTFYYRENFLNVAIRKTKGLEYYVWIDAHQTFLNTYWWEEAVIKMEHYNNVQFFQNLVWLNKWNNGTDRVQDLHSVQYAYTITKDLNKYFAKFDRMWNGNAVGIRREIYEGLGFILDKCIAGCCDCAFNVAGMRDHWDRVDKFGNYGAQLRPWILDASKVFKGEVAVVRGRMHHFHHDHFFAWEKNLNALTRNNWNLDNELYRDENYTLHIKWNSPLLGLFKQVHSH